MMMNQAEFFGAKIKNAMPFSEDVIIEILIYLPVKSLMRFRCVSKYLCALIKNPVFVTRHLKCDHRKNMLLKRYLPVKDSKNIDEGGENVFSFHDPYSPNLLVSPNLSIPVFNDAPEFIQLFGPCNGLVCLVSNEIIILCNPALREFELLAPSTFAHPDGYVDRPLGSGFGFDSNANSYKFVHLLNIQENIANFFVEDEEFYNRQEDSYIRVDMFNSSTNSWKLIDVVVPEVWYNPGFDLFFNDACHWQADIPPEGPESDIPFEEAPPPVGLILSFNIKSEAFQQFEYPDFYDKKYPTLMVLNQCLALIRHGAWTNEPQAIDLWVMKKYGIKESWTKELIIVPYLFRRPFFLWKNEWLLVDTGEGQLAYCALHANETKTFQIYGFENSMRAVIFTESTISLNHVANRLA